MKVWGGLGLQEMPNLASTEHSKASLRGPLSPEMVSSNPEEEPMSPIQPRNLFGSEDTSNELSGTDVEDEESDVSLGAKVTISAEGYAKDTYMLALSVLALLAMLVATSKWLKATGQEVNAKKLLAFSATSSIRGKPPELRVTLDGVELPVQQDSRQLGVGVRTWPKRGTGPLLKHRIADGKTALRKARVIPRGFNRKATVAAVMIVVVALFGVELADIAQRDVSSMEAAIMSAIWGPSRPCRAKELVFTLLMPGHRVASSMVVPDKRMC